MERFSEDNTRNARIRINYNKNPKVKFSYPNIKNYEEGSTYIEFMMVWTLVIVIMYSTFLLISPFLEYAFSKASSDINYTIYSMLGDFLINSFIVFIFLGVPFLVTKVLSKPLKRFYPKWQKIKHIVFGFYYEITLNKNHLRIEKNKIYLEIPMFSNVFLEYIAKKDFRKYLDYFEIKEYNLKEASKVFSRKKEIHSLDIFWYARFYFKKEPKEGEIKVKFI